MQLYNFFEIFNSIYLKSAFLAWFIAQVLKIPFNYMVTKELDFKRAWGSGGMPSSHTAGIVAVTVSIGMTKGFDSAMFAVPAVMSTIVMYDAAGVRRAAGKHAKIINEIRESILTNKEISQEQLKELIGHTPFEVAGGFVLGIIVGVVTTLIRFNVQNVFK